MDTNKKDKDPGCLLIVAAVVLATVIGGIVEICQRIVKNAAKIEKPVNTVKPTEKKAINLVPQIFWNNKNIRTR